MAQRWKTPEKVAENRKKAKKKLWKTGKMKSQGNHFKSWKAGKV